LTNYKTQTVEMSVHTDTSRERRCNLETKSLARISRMNIARSAPHQHFLQITSGNLITKISWKYGRHIPEI